MNANSKQITNLLLEVLTANPTAATAGRIFYNSTDDQVGYDNGSRVREIPMLGKNLLLNGDFRVWQRGTGPFTSVTTPLNNDDTYLADRWIFLADGADTADVSQETTTVPTGSYGAILLDVETANRKFGILQVVEARDSARLIGGRASLQFKARVTGSSISNLRAAILSWSSTADTVTSDVVSAWAAAGTDPTLVANWTYENTPSNLAVTTSYQTFRIENIAVDTASTTNVAAFIWVDDTDATVGDFVYITDVQLEVGRACTDTEARPLALEEILCQRFAWAKTPATTKIIAQAALSSTTAGAATHHLPTRMRAIPTLTLDSQLRFEVLDQANVSSGTSAVSAGGRTTADAGQFSFTTANALTAGAALFSTSSITGAFFLWDAEL